VQGTVFAIAARHRAHPNQLAGARDFTCVSEGELDVGDLLHDARYSLYCVERGRGQAYFVETPPDVDLHGAPFLYQAQFEHAERVVAVSCMDLVRAAGEIPQTPSDDLIFIHSVGRAGSTLLRRALCRCPGVLGVSEPDALLQCVGKPPAGGDAELLESCVRILCSGIARAEPRSRCVIKMRSMGIKLGGLLHRLFPAAAALFIYRSATRVVTSSLRAFHPLPPEIVEYHEDPVRFLTQHWLSVMQHYLTLYRSGASVRAVRYEDLVEHPHDSLPEICRFLGIACADLVRIDEALAEDAQAGSNVSRERLREKSLREFGGLEEIERKVKDILAGHPELTMPDCVLPGTLAHGANA
jgi:hypothetical protein